MSGWWGTRISEMFNEMYPGVPSIGAVALGAWLILVVLSIVLHELAHGWMAIRCGDDTPRLLGHMTLDPIKHMGVVSLILLALVGIAWGSMPVNRDNLRRRHDDALVSLAGPMMNLALCALFVVGAIISALVLRGDAQTYARVVCNIGSVMNLTLAVLNLLPLPPLDGSRILSSFVRPLREAFEAPAASLIGLVAFLLIGRTVGVYIVLAAVAVCVGFERVVLSLLGQP